MRMNRDYKIFKLHEFYGCILIGIIIIYQNYD